MSVQMMSLVYQSGLKKTQKAIALAYADHADDHGENIYPSVEYISWKTGYSERTVQRTTQQLIESGILLEAGQGPRGTNRFRLIIDNLPKRKPFRWDSHPTDTRGDKMTGVTTTTEKVSSMSPDPSVEPYKYRPQSFSEETIPINVGDPNDPKAEQLREMITAMTSICKGYFNPFRTNDPILLDSWILIENGHTPEQVREFGVWWKKKGFYEGKPASKSVVDGIENFLAGVEPSKNGRRNYEAEKAWREVQRWLARTIKANQFSSPTTIRVIGQMGESTFKNMPKDKYQETQRTFYSIFETLSQSPTE